MLRQIARTGLLGSTVSSAILLIFAGSFFPHEAYAAAGRTPGAYAVSPTGAATYTIPIWAPGGPHGMQPHIALTYNSQQGNGYVGVGWGVSGLSAISRCNLTIAQDGAAVPIALATSDGYCMNGQRLRLTGGTYGAANSTYQTEIANFVNVQALGAAGNGPATWLATDKNGWQYTYGGGGTTSHAQVLASGSTTAISWQLNEVIDPYGNSMTITYWTNNVTGEVVPNVISWVPASSGSSSYNYTMTFAYVAQGSLHGYVAGTPFSDTNLLSSIAIAYQGTAVKTYYLNYSNTTTATSRYLLTQVQECAGTGTGNCLQPTSISWQAGAAGVGSATSLGGTVGSVVSAVYDLSGDGKNDLVMISSSGQVLVALGSSTGYSAAVSTGLSAGTGGVLIGDVDGSGVASLLVGASDGYWHYYKGWNGSAFAQTGSTGMAVASFPSAVLADLDGDGRADLAYVGSDGYMHVRFNTSTGGTVSFSSTDINSLVLVNDGLISPRNVSTRGLHFWGGPQEDVLGVYKYCTTYRNGTCIGWAYETNVMHYFPSGHTFDGMTVNNSSYQPLTIVDYADYNDDGCTDILASTELILSSCNTSNPTLVALPTGATAAIGGMDWNGDGRRDVLVSQSNGNIGVVLSTGSGLASTVTNTSIPYSSSTTYSSVSNLTGDGQDALLAWNGTSLTYSLHNSPGSPPDLLSSVADGYGNSASPTYTTIAQGSGTVYTPGASGAYPDPNYIGPLYVVSQTTFSDPSSATGGTYTQSATYSSALQNLLGRGFDGFNTVSMTDSRNALKDSSSFEQIFPYTGMKSQDILSGSAYSFNLSTTTNTLAPLVTLSSTLHQERYFAYFAKVNTVRLEVSSIPGDNGEANTTTTTNYTLDNFGNPTTIATTVTDNDPNSPYTGQSWTRTTTNIPDESTSPYCLRLFTQTQTAYTASSGAAVTITKALTPDLTHCNYKQIVTTSNSGSAYAVTEALGYDAFGNVATDSVTGAGMGGASPATRTTTINWTSTSATTGQFPITVTDPSLAVTTYAYNYSWGNPSSVTDPNNLTTSWQYTDGFGRKTQETRPDGTSTTWSYSDCNPNCLIGTHGTYATHTVYAVGGSTVVTDGTDYLDSVDRPLVSKARMLASGSYSRNEQRYDSLGRTAQVMMPCAWTALTTACPYSTTNNYDVVNRLKSSARPISSTNSMLQTTNYAYAGRTTTVTDPLSNTRTVIQDVNGWLRRTQDPYNYYVTLAYDAAGNKTTVTDSAGNSLWSGAYAYGAAAFLTSMTDMDLGAWTYTPDALGEVTAWTDAKGQNFSMTFDALSRPRTRTEPDLYTSWTWGSTPSAHNVGKLASVCTGTGTNPTDCTANPGYSESETYDSIGRPSQRAITLPSSGTYTYTSAYDPTTGLLNTLTYPASYPSTCQVTVQYGYSNGVLSSLTDASNRTYCGSTGTVFWTANTMDPMGHVTQETLGNGIVTNRAFDAVTHWLNSVQSGVGGGATAQNQSFLFDEMGNLTQRQDNNLGLTEGIWYDNDYRLSYTKLNGTQNLTLSYDVTGNITSRSDVAGGATWTYDPNHKHEVTQAGSSANQFAYDANGNVTGVSTRWVSWWSFNYPDRINIGTGGTSESTVFSYGPDRSRWQQIYINSVGSQTVTSYIGGLMEVIGGTYPNYRHYIYAGSEPVAVYARSTNGTNTLSYFLQDHQGSISSITSSSGSAVVNESFTPFGVRRDPTTWSGSAINADLTAAAGITQQGYTFQTTLGMWMGLNHMNGRVQDAVIGRFLSADPYIPDPTNTQSYNRYSYVNNNPLSLVDPTGFDADCINPDGTKCLDAVIVNGTRLTTLSPGDTNASPSTSPGRSSNGDPSSLPEVVVTAPKPRGNPNKPVCLNFSAGISGSAMGPVAGPVGVGLSGGQSIGVSYGGSLLDSSLFWSAQAAGMVSGGVFAGVGIAAQGSSGAVAPGITTTTALHSETNIGAGLEGSVTADFASDGNASVGGYSEGLPGARLGVGAGFASGFGVSTTTTVGTPTLRQILNALGISTGLAAGC